MYNNKKLCSRQNLAPFIKRVRLWHKQWKPAFTLIVAISVWRMRSDVEISILFVFGIECFQIPTHFWKFWVHPRRRLISIVMQIHIALKPLQKRALETPLLRHPNSIHPVVILAAAPSPSSHFLGSSHSPLPLPSHPYKYPWYTGEAQCLLPRSHLSHSVVPHSSSSLRTRLRKLFAKALVNLAANSKPRPLFFAHLTISPPINVPYLLPWSGFLGTLPHPRRISTMPDGIDPSTLADVPRSIWRFCD